MKLYELIKKGGVYDELEGGIPKEALASLTGALPPHKGILPDVLLNAILEREALMSTGIGYGIAVPHPRNPPIDNPEEQFAALGFLKRPIDWNALDRKPVDTLFLIVSSSPRFHLEALSRISYFCHDGNFQKLLRERDAKRIIGFINDAEEEWEKS